MPLPDAQVKEAIARKWDESSLTYDDHMGHGIKSDEEREAWKSVLKKAIPTGAVEILDVGCGTGEISLLLAEMGFKVTGIDLSDKMLEKARSKAAARGMEIRYEKGDAENLPVDGGVFDAIFCRHLLWTLPNPVKALEEWKRVLKDGGRVMVVDGVWDDGSLDAKARRFVSNAFRLILERKNPWKDNYPSELRAALPNAGGTPLEKAKGYLEAAGFVNCGHMDLLHVRDIQKKGMPWRDRIRFNYAYYLVYGDK